MLKGSSESDSSVDSYSESMDDLKSPPTVDLTDRVDATVDHIDLTVGDSDSSDGENKPRAKSRCPPRRRKVIITIDSGSDSDDSGSDSDDSLLPPAAFPPRSRDKATPPRVAAMPSRVNPTTPQTPMSLVDSLAEQPTLFGTPRDQSNLKNIRNMLDEFLSYQLENEPSADWTTKESWEAKSGGDPLGYLMANFCTWAVWKKNNTLSLLTLHSRVLRDIYSEVTQRYVGWTTVTQGGKGLELLRQQSAVYRDTTKMLNRVCIGRTSDIKRANPLYEVDISRFRSCMPPTVIGARDMSLMYAIFESAARGKSFTDVVVLTTQPYYNPVDSRWTLTYPAAK